MTRSGYRSHLLLIATLAVLSVRAVTPEGYMVGSPASGLLFELCPSGMPAEIMQALAGGQHHHHHDKGGQSQGGEPCPIGHMLASAVAVDIGSSPELSPAAPGFGNVPLAEARDSRAVVYRSRAPPA